MIERLDQLEKDKFIKIGGAIFDKTATLKMFETNDVTDKVDNVTKIGKETSNGGWLVLKIDETSGVEIRFATMSNNASVKTYSDAWTNRDTLTYGTYSQAFPS